MDEVTYKLLYMLNSLNFVNVGQSPLFILQHAPHVWAINKTLHVHTIFNHTETMANQVRIPRSDTMLSVFHGGVLQRG